MELYCKHCDYTFEIDWETIWESQECTHEYVGHHLNDTFISCPKCDEICGDEVKESIPVVKKAAEYLVVGLKGYVPLTLIKNAKLSK